MRLTKKLAIVAVGTVAAVGATSAAWAYWTTTGAGTGSSTASASNGTIVLHASFPQGIAPGQSRDVSFTADNAGDTDLRVGTVSSVVSTSNPGCLADWFSIAGVVQDQTIAAHSTGVALANKGSLNFANNAANQDPCKSASITLTLTSN